VVIIQSEMLMPLATNDAQSAAEKALADEAARSDAFLSMLEHERRFEAMRRARVIVLPPVPAAVDAPGRVS